MGIRNITGRDDDDQVQVAVEGDKVVCQYLHVGDYMVLRSFFARRPPYPVWLKGMFASAHRRDGLRVYTRLSRLMNFERQLMVQLTLEDL